MRHLKLMGLTAIAAAALMALAGTASATMYYNSTVHNSSTTLGVGTIIHYESENTTVLHPPIGDIECKHTTWEGKITDAGGPGRGVVIQMITTTWRECNATVTTLANGTLEANWTSGSNASLKSSGTEVTVEFSGFHCIFKTSSTGLGTVTGSATTGSTSTLDVSATIPRTGGKSGAFCGSTAQWTGSLKGTGPDTLDITDS